MRIGQRISAILKGNGSPHDGIAAHYRAFWGKDQVEEVHWTPGHLGSRLPDFHIAKVKPAEPGGMWTFASIGAWCATDGEAHGLEFVAVSRGQSAAVMRRLGMIAYYHAGPPANLSLPDDGAASHGPASFSPGSLARPLAAASLLEPGRPLPGP